MHYLSAGVTPGNPLVKAAFQKASTRSSVSWKQYFPSICQGKEKEGLFSKYDLQ